MKMIFYSLQGELQAPLIPLHHWGFGQQNRLRLRLMSVKGGGGRVCKNVGRVPVIRFTWIWLKLMTGRIVRNWKLLLHFVFFWKRFEGESSQKAEILQVTSWWGNCTRELIEGKITSSERKQTEKSYVINNSWQVLFDRERGEDVMLLEISHSQLL